MYLVSGDEPLLVQEACDLIRTELKKIGFSERELHHAETGFDWNTLLYSSNSMSLFSDKKLVEVRMSSAKPNDSAKEVLLEITSAPSDDTVFLIVMPKLDKNTMRSKWYKAIDGIGLHIPIWPIENNRLGGWLGARFKSAGLRASREVVELMAERVEGNLLAAVQEIERLKLIVSGDKVEIKDVIEGVADSARYDVFKLIDIVLLGDASKTVRMLQGLKTEGVEILFIVNMFVRELRSLDLMKAAVVSGQTMQSALKTGRIWQKREGPVTQCLRRHSHSQIQELTQSMGTIDRMVKGIEIGDPWRELQNVLLTLAGSVSVAKVSSL